MKVTAHGVQGQLRMVETTSGEMVAFKCVMLGELAIKARARGMHVEVLGDSPSDAIASFSSMVERAQELFGAEAPTKHRLATPTQAERVKFDNLNPDHMRAYAKFLKEGVWDLKFELDPKYDSVDRMIRAIIIDYALAPFEATTAD